MIVPCLLSRGQVEWMVICFLSCQPITGAYHVFFFCEGPRLAAAYGFTVVRTVPSRSNRFAPPTSNVHTTKTFTDCNGDTSVGPVC